jgi:hypothetical protein
MLEFVFQVFWIGAAIAGSCSRHYDVVLTFLELYLLTSLGNEDEEVAALIREKVSEISGKIMYGIRLGSRRSVVP